MKKSRRHNRNLSSFNYKSKKIKRRCAKDCIDDLINSIINIYMEFAIGKPLTSELAMMDIAYNSNYLIHSYLHKLKNLTKFELFTYLFGSSYDPNKVSFETTFLSATLSEPCSNRYPKNLISDKQARVNTKYENKLSILLVDLINNKIKTELLHETETSLINQVYESFDSDSSLLATIINDIHYSLFQQSIRQSILISIKVVLCEIETSIHQDIFQLSSERSIDDHDITEIVNIEQKSHKIIGKNLIESKNDTNVFDFSFDFSTYLDQNVNGDVETLKNISDSIFSKFENSISIEHSDLTSYKSMIISNEVTDNLFNNLLTQKSTTQSDSSSEIYDNTINNLLNELINQIINTYVLNDCKIKYTESTVIDSTMNSVEIASANYVHIDDYQIDTYDDLSKELNEFVTQFDILTNETRFNDTGDLTNSYKSVNFSQNFDDDLITKSNQKEISIKLDMKQDGDVIYNELSDVYLEHNIKYDIKSFESLKSNKISKQICKKSFETLKTESDKVNNDKLTNILEKIHDVIIFDINVSNILIPNNTFIKWLDVANKSVICQSGKYQKSLISGDQNLDIYQSTNNNTAILDKVKSNVIFQNALVVINYEGNSSHCIEFFETETYSFML